MIQRSIPSLGDPLPLAVILLALGTTVGCGSGDDTPENEQNVDQTPGPEDEPLPPGPPGIHREADGVVFRTEPFTLQPGQERFVCYTQTLTENVVVDGYTKPTKPFLHHMVFAKTLGGEPEGSTDCDVLFRFSWEPMFLAGAGVSALQFPDGVGQVLPAGTRLLAQLHL